MHTYAQINAEGVCIGLVQTCTPLHEPGVIAIEQPDSQLLGQRWDGSAWNDPAAQAAARRPHVVITRITATGPNAEQLHISKNGREVTVPVGATLSVQAELRVAGQIAPITDTFRLPLVSEDGRHRLVLINVVQGQFAVHVPMQDSRLWRITEERINSMLPAEAQMRFDGLNIYAVETA